MEYFDVLDEKGMYTGEVKTREECHEKGLWHKAIVVFIINSKNQILLQKRSAKKKLWPNMWDFSAGGHVDSGEFGYQAAIRECKEEIGIELDKKDITFIGCVTSTNIKGNIINNHFNEHYVAIKDVDLSEIKMQEDEVTEVKWVDKDEIIARIKNNYENITDKVGAWEYLVKYYEMMK